MLKSILPKFLQPKPKNNGTKTVKPSSANRRASASRGALKRHENATQCAERAPKAAGLDSIELTDYAWLVDDLLPMNGKCMLVGEPGVGKTMLTMDIAVSVAAASKVLGRFQAKKGRVLIYSPEMTLPAMKRRIINAAELKGVSPGGLDIEFTPEGRYYEFDRESSQNEFRLLIADSRPSLLIADPLAFCIAGSENSDKCADRVAGFMTLLSKEYDLTSLIVHHTTDGRARGSGRWRSYPDMGLLLEKQKGVVVFSRTKERETARLEPMQLEFAKSGTGVALRINERPVQVEMDTEERIIAYLRREPLKSYREVRKNVKGRAASILNLMKALEKIGVLTKDENCLWSVVDGEPEAVPIPGDI